jgi:SAM-dependent methyltransferase
MSPHEQLKQTQQKTWATGDFSRIGVSQVLVGELLCDAIALHAGERVLDIATGAGNTALAAARRAAEVTGVDFVPALLERGRERANAERLRVTFQEADTEALPFPDGSFDVVLSTFGHMFAPDYSKAASEMARVCRKGGRVGFAAWIPVGFIGGMFAINQKYGPPTPPEFSAPAMWGEEAVVRERFGPYAAHFQFNKRAALFRALTPQDWLAYMREFFGPTRVMWERLDEANREALNREMLELLGRFNQSGDSTLYAAGEYLEVVIHLR